AGTVSIQAFFIRGGQNWGHRAFFPAHTADVPEADVLSSFLVQFYEDLPPPRRILVDRDLADRALLEEALCERAGRKVAIEVPQRGSRRKLIEQARRNAEEALDRRLAETTTQGKVLRELADTFELAEVPKRLEVYDNSHIMGTNATGAMIVAGPEGFRKNSYRKFNIKRPETQPGDDFAMMREVLERRFKRLINPPEEGAAKTKDDDFPQWPDLVIIDGGRGQLNAVREIFANLGLTQVALMSVAKGPDRDAGRETLFMPEREAIKLEPRDPVLYFIQRLRDEAHRFVIGSHRKLRKKDIREAGLQEIPGIGPSRKRALLHHFGTLKEIERASITDLGKVPGVSAESARRIFEYFHPQPG
ncbi:MAG: excinuclease ABC subunit UvrC, partial [Bradyrhizobium canariense]